MGWFSDIKGGQQAVGVVQKDPPTTSGGAGSVVNDAVDLFYQARGYQPLFTQLELSLSAAKLLDLDIMSKSDPIALLYARKQNGVLEELGRTEVIMNNLNPSWIQKIDVTYQFEVVQPLVFHVYDVDTKYHNLPTKEIKLGDQEFLGEASCALSEIVTKHDQSITLNLHNNRSGRPKSCGTITIHAEENAVSKLAAEIVFRCTHLPNTDFLSKSDPFLRISRISESGALIPFCKTEVVNNNLNPSWKPVCLTTQQFGSKDIPLIIECFDFNSGGNHELIGKLQTSLAGLETLHKERIGVNFTKQHHGREKVLKGRLFVDVLREKQLYSFIDYIASGFQLNFMVAVDFTASNGDPNCRKSLHYIDPSGHLNAYQQAITEVGEVIQFYDYDRHFPAWGFGARMQDGSTSHCFCLNPYSSEVEGVEGIMAAYAGALRSYPLYGPTIFGKVIHKAADIAAQSLSQNAGKYYVLLIITDGVLSDLQETKDALVKASDLPLSVLILGVGDADFTQMEILDADKGRRLESSTGRTATRDIVQFVPMREVHGEQKSIVQSLLQELPGQFLTYMRSRDMKPHPIRAPAASQSHPI